MCCSVKQNRILLCLGCYQTLCIDLLNNTAGCPTSNYGDGLSGCAGWQRLGDLIQFWVTAKYFSSASFICCDSWVSYSGASEELSLLKCYHVSIGKQLSTFQRNVVASSSGRNSPVRSRIVCGATAQIGPWPPHCWGWSNTIWHTDPVRMLWTSDQQVAGAATYTTHKKKQVQSTTVLLKM